MNDVNALAADAAQAVRGYDDVGHKIMLVLSSIALILWCVAGYFIIQGILVG